MKQDISIIGAGIGGLTTALTLRRLGHDVSLYESAPEIKPVGAGIVMANNAMQIFRKLGIDRKIESAGNKVASLKIADERLNGLSLVDLSKFEVQYGVYNVAIHRAELQKILAEELGLERIYLSKRLSKIERRDDFHLVFEDTTTANSRIVIGADGIHSTVRNQLFPTAEIRDTRQWCWRGVGEIKLPNEYHNQALEAWGKGRRFGFVKISPTKVYWYAVVNEGLVTDEKVALVDLFHAFHSDILRIIDASPRENTFFSKIIDLKPIDKWQDRGVCLIGDAAHATTPNMGQGACQAVEDAYAIGRLLQSGRPIEQVFAEYEGLRMNKAHGIVNTSWTMGKLAHVENGLGIWLRNGLMRILPKSANDGQLAKVFDIGYIDRHSKQGG
jgi:2-polyprenyl-6-methoxyphenol hydroxylase-like FAD-dependent oxidoreductase